jgi:hypothetical protein
MATYLKHMVGGAREKEAEASGYASKVRQNGRGNGGREGIFVKPDTIA